MQHDKGYFDHSTERDRQDTVKHTLIQFGDIVPTMKQLTERDLQEGHTWTYHQMKKIRGFYETRV